MHISFRFIFWHLAFFFKAVFLSVKRSLEGVIRKGGATVRFDKEKGQDLALFQSQSGKDKCVGCKICEVACPAQAIIIDTQLDERLAPYASRFDVDMTKCISCGLCEQACPVDAIGLVDRRLLTVDEKEKLYHTKETLLENGRLFREEKPR